MDNKYVEQMIAELQNLRIPFEVYAIDGTQIAPVHKTEPSLDVGQLQFKNELATDDERLYISLDKNPGVLVAVPRELQNGEALARMFAVTIALIDEKSGRGMDKEAVLRGILLGEIDGPQAEMLAREHGIDLVEERCVVYFQVVSGESAPLYDALSELFSDSKDDFAVDLGKSAIALVRAAQHANFQELPEFVSAVATTVQEEAGTVFIAGIGEPRVSLLQLFDSMLEAKHALDIGRNFHVGQSVFMYRNLLLERFVKEVDKNTAKKYYDLLFSRRNSRTFNEEMIKTIDTFFECHLNVSEAARRLYIHRNTLVYRLDKVQKATGLDLRTFDDAITFKLLRMLGRRSQMK